MPYGNGDYVVFQDQLFQCVSSRGLCEYFSPGAIKSWTTTSTDTFELDDKFGEVAYGADCPWVLVTDLAYGALTDASTVRAEVTLIDWFASYTFLEEYAGYHWFALGEQACVMGQSANCTDEALCNTVAPYVESNQDGAAWNSTGYVCNYNDTYPEPVYCDYMFDTPTADVPALLPYDVICDQTNLPTVTIYTCKDASQGGYNCTTFSPLSGTVADDIALSWNVTTTTDDVMMYVPVGSWWMDYEDELTQECYNWKEATDKNSERPYVFEIADYACDAGMVFECMEPKYCNTIQPS